MIAGKGPAPDGNSNRAGMGPAGMRAPVTSCGGILTNSCDCAAQAARPNNHSKGHASKPERIFIAPLSPRDRSQSIVISWA